MLQNVPECMQIHELACRSMSLHAVTWAYTQLHKLVWSYISLHELPKLTCSYINLHRVTWACMQFPELLWSSISFNEVQWAYMKFHELACSFMSLFAVLITCYFLKWAISWTSWRKSVSSNTVIRNWLVLATRNKWNFRSESGVDHFEYWYFHLATMTYSHKIYE